MLGPVWECFRVVRPRGGGGGGTASNAPVAPTELINGRWQVIGTGAAAAGGTVAAGAVGAKAVRKHRALNEGELVCHQTGWAPAPFVPPGYFAAPFDGYPFGGGFGGLLGPSGFGLGGVGGVGGLGGFYGGGGSGGGGDHSGAGGLGEAVVELGGVPGGGAQTVVGGTIPGGTVPVPEPASIAIFIFAIAALTVVARRKPA